MVDATAAVLRKITACGSRSAIMWSRLFSRQDRSGLRSSAKSVEKFFFLISSFVPHDLSTEAAYRLEVARLCEYACEANLSELRAIPVMTSCIELLGRSAHQCASLVEKACHSVKKRASVCIQFTTGRSQWSSCHITDEQEDTR